MRRKIGNPCREILARAKIGRKEKRDGSSPRMWGTYCFYPDFPFNFQRVTFYQKNGTKNHVSTLYLDQI